MFFKSILIVSSLFFTQLTLTMEQEHLSIYTAIDNDDIPTLQDMLTNETSKNQIKALGHAVLQRAIFSRKIKTFEFIIDAKCCDVNEYKKDYLQEWIAPIFTREQCKHGHTLLEAIDRNRYNLPGIRSFLDILRKKEVWTGGALDGDSFVAEHMARPCLLQ